MRRKKIIPPVVRNQWDAWSKWRCQHCRKIYPEGSEVWEANKPEIQTKYGFYLCKECAKKIIEAEGGAA